MNEELYMGFENYLNNEMLPKEQSDFEQRLENDPEFRDSFQQYKESTQFLEARFSKESGYFKENLNSISSQYFNENQSQKGKTIVFRPWQFAVAASLIIIMGTWFFMQGSDVEYNDYNQHESAYFTERGADDVHLKKAQDFFNAQEYGKAVSAFESIKQQTPEIQYFYAIALIETNHFAESTLILNGMRKGSSAFKDKATWYLALSNLKQGRTLECKKWLKLIPQESEDFQKAQEILDKLD